MQATRRFSIYDSYCIALLLSVRRSARLWGRLFEWAIVAPTVVLRAVPMLPSKLNPVRSSNLYTGLFPQWCRSTTLKAHVLVQMVGLNRLKLSIRLLRATVVSSLITVGPTIVRCVHCVKIVSCLPKRRNSTVELS